MERKILDKPDISCFLETPSNHSVKPVTYVRDLSTKQAIRDFLDKNKATATPLLHLLLNAPNSGFGWTPEDLKDIKDHTGAKLVITAIEFFRQGKQFKESKLNVLDHLKTTIEFFKEEKQIKKYKLDILNYLKLADRIIFLDKLDRRLAIEVARLYFPKETDLMEKLKAATIILSREVVAEQHIDVYESVGVSLEQECIPTKSVLTQKK